MTVGPTEEPPPAAPIPESGPARSGSEGITLIELAVLGVVGAVVGVAGQFAPWGNGVSVPILILTAFVSVLISHLVLRRFRRLPTATRLAVAAAIAIGVTSAVSYVTSHPPREATLAYMLRQDLPSGLRCDFVRKQWFDGAVYIAAFQADAAEVQHILAGREYEAVEGLTPETFKSRWRGDFQLAQLADASWQFPPKVVSPRIYLWAIPPRPPNLPGEFAAILIDDADGSGRMLYSVGLLSNTDPTF